MVDGDRFSSQKKPLLGPWDGAIFILTQDMDIHHGCDMDSPCFSKLIWDNKWDISWDMIWDNMVFNMGSYGIFNGI